MMSKRWFESMVLIQLQEILGLSRQFFMEQLLVDAEEQKVMRYYHIEMFWEVFFFKQQQDNAAEKVLSALEFLSKQIKKDASKLNSDFCVCFLEAFDLIFPKYLRLEKSAGFRQNILYSFIRTVKLLLREKFFQEFECTSILEEALIQKTIYVLRLAQHKDTVDMSIFSLQQLLNEIKVQKTITIFPQVFSLITHAFISFSKDRPKIPNYTQKIFEYYICQKKSATVSHWPQIQFIMLQCVSSGNGKITQAVEQVAADLYCSSHEIEKSIRALLRQISRSCEDIRILAVKYILEILEQKDKNDNQEIHKVLCRPDILKLVYQCILELKQSSDTPKSINFGVFCAKVIAFIGLCHPFVNDPILLKANNQHTLKQSGNEHEETKTDEKIISAQSERVKPLTNMKYNLQTVDNTLELLAVPSLSRLPLERDSPVIFAQKLKEIIGELAQLNEQKPKNYYFAQFLLTRFIKTNGGDEKKKNLRGDQIMNDPLEAANAGHKIDAEQQFQKEIYRADLLAKAVNRFSSITKLKESPKTLQAYIESPFLYKLALYLINKIDDQQWQQVFEACIPLVKKELDFVKLVLPYLTYFTIRNQLQDDNQLADQISIYMNQILESSNTVDMELSLSLIEFLKIAISQDKMRFKQWIETTKFRYSDKLFALDLQDKQENVVNFINSLSQDQSIKKSFLVVRKLERLLSRIDKGIRNSAAKKVRNLKRCLFNMEDTYRQTIQSSSNFGGFLEDMPEQDVIEIVRIQKQLMPEDFDSTIFNQIINKEHSNNFSQVFNKVAIPHLHNNDPVTSLKNELGRLFQNAQPIKDWKQGNWQALANWLGDFDIARISEYGKKLPYLLEFEVDDKKHQFELILALLFGEYYKATQYLLRSNDFSISTDTNYKNYMDCLQKIIAFIDFLYFEFISTLELQQGETSAFYKLFLHVLYEIQTALYFLKDMFVVEAEKVSEHLKREVNRDKRKFEKIYFEIDLNIQFEKLLGWLEERSTAIGAANESMQLIYYVRLVIFQIYDRENEYAFYLMKLAKLHRKQKQDVLIVNRFFKECGKLESKIIDYELEYCKYTYQTKNAHEAYQYLHNKLEHIKQKCDQMQKQIGAQWMPKLVYQKAQLLELDLLIKIDHRNVQIFDNFTLFVKQIEELKWEKPNFLFAQYIDMLERSTPKISEVASNNNQKDEEVKKNHIAERNRRHIQRIFYYMRSIQHGHKYIWQSLPRALELWFEFKNDNDNKIATFMRQELKKLESYKIATVLQLLLSRFGHERKEVRETIIEVLSQLAAGYPEHCAWWIFHFHFFEDVKGQHINQHQKTQMPTQSAHAISRHDFSAAIINKMLTLDKKAAETLMKSEVLFGDLKKLSEKEVKQQEHTIEMTKSLQAITTTTNLVMPIEENLTPQLPARNFKTDYYPRALVQTSLPISEHNRLNLDATKKSAQTQEATFPAYKTNPIKIQGFLAKIDVMTSKERPKKISIVGTDGKVYNFLLKCDKQGDLRKEQRFIDFAMLCNKMLNQDSNARQRGLRLRTYSIVPLSRHTGLIEWIQNTSTLKIVVNEQWKRYAIKGEMAEIKKMAQAQNKGDTHTLIWPQVKASIKPVLATWFAEHFPSPEIWYEARVNFIKTCAIWSIIGYVIGLGDRHGDNILIHQHTGEVTHVDFDCIFEKGAKLKVPEIVPFRLTANIIDAFGIFKEKGIFQKCAEVVLRVMRKNQKNIISYLDSFKHDPLVENPPNIKVEIKDALEVIEKKLMGNINIGSGVALTVEEQVEQVILNAINEDSLSKMYIGWMPWL